MKKEKKSVAFTKTQLALLFLPFLGTVVYLINLLLTKRYYSNPCVLSLLISSGITLAAGAVLGIIGLFAYTVTLIISLILMGIVMNFMFFKSYNKRKSIEDSENKS